MSMPQSVTVADSFRQSPEVVAALDAVIQRLESSQASITDARPPVDGGTETLEGWLARSKEARGKGALYPYVLSLIHI